MNATAKLDDNKLIEFRKVRESDMDLFLKYFDGLSARTRYFFHPFSFDRKSAAAVVADADSSNNHRLVAVARDEDRELIAGYAWIQGMERSDIPMLGIGVIDEYQNVGLGKRMLMLLIKHARQLNLDKIKLGVFDDNPRAIHVYESVGFRIDPTIPPRKQGAHEEIYMILNLKDDFLREGRTES